VSSVERRDRIAIQNRSGIRVIGAINNVELIAFGRGIREEARLTKVYGAGRWRKLKGVARVSCCPMAARRWRKYTGTNVTATAAES
jgi:hypothetical protein